MKRLSLFVLVALLWGCTTPQPVKQASTDMTATLVDLQQAQKDLKSLYVAEIDKTILLVRQSIISMRVEKTIKGLQQKEKEGDLIGISKEIYETRISSECMLDVFSTWVQDNLGDGDDASKKINEFSSGVAERFRRQADKFKTSKPELSKKLTAKAAVFEDADIRNLNSDTRTGLKTLFHLYKAKKIASRNLDDLKTYINVLAAMHQTIDGWIQTEVTVSGADVANLVLKHSETLGFEDSKSKEVK